MQPSAVIPFQLKVIDRGLQDPPISFHQTFSLSCPIRDGLFQNPTNPPVQSTVCQQLRRTANMYTKHLKGSQKSLVLSLVPRAFS